MEFFNTFGDVLRHIEATYSNSHALNWRDKEGWHAISTAEMLQEIRALVLGLHQMGLRKGQCVGILANSSPFWTIADMAIMIAGGVTVPLFANISEENFVYEVSQTQLKVIFVEGQEQWEVFNRHLHMFQHAIALDETSHINKVIPVRDIKARGETLDEQDPELFDKLLQASKPSDLAAIIYTSGSTGTPKGVELTHQNILTEIEFNAFQWKAGEDRYLSVLPLAHVFGHCINLWMLIWGVSIYYSSDYKNLGMICREIKPTALVVVPRLLEKVYLKMMETMHSSKGIKRMIGEWAFGLANQERKSKLQKLLLPLADHLVYSKLRQALGGNIRVVISGGAPLNPHLHAFFHEIGVPIYEGWGLTEACPVCINIPEKNKIGTVGPPLSRQKLKISAEGEVLVKGSLVMRGYFNSPEATARTIDSEGWLHTGDRGVLDSDGYLTIKGRMKELYKTSTGEYVAPVPIEQALCRCPLIDMAMVVAEGRKFASCLLFPNQEALIRLKGEQKKETLSDEAFLDSAYIRNEIDKLLYCTNEHLNHWEQVHAYRFILEPLSIQAGELTPSMKIRREVVANKYSNVIDSMYREEGE